MPRCCPRWSRFPRHERPNLVDTLASWILTSRCQQDLGPRAAGVGYLTLITSGRSRCHGAAAPRPSLSGATRRAPLAPSTSAWAAAPHADHVDCRYAYQDQALHPTPATARLRRLRSPPRPPQRPPLLQPPHRHPPPVSPLLGRTRRRRRAPPRPHPPASHAKHMTISLAQISRQRVAGGTRYDARADHG